MKVYGIGIIGYGGFGKFLQHSWKKMENVRVVAVSSEKSSHPHILEAKFYRDWKDLLKDGEVDIVSVATPPSSHGIIACSAMESGKHVLIEKPITITMEEGIKILSTQKDTGKSASVNYMMRFNPIVDALGELSRKKAFGELRRADVENYAQDSALPPEHWFWDRTVSGGILIEHAVHFIDMVNSLTDQKHVSATGLCHYRNERQQDQVLASVLYERGLIASHYHAFAYPGFFESTSIRLVYDLAVFDISGWIPLKGQFTALVNPYTREELSLLPGLALGECEKIQNIKDFSRPEGWGDIDPHQPPHKEISSHGVAYGVEEMVKGTFEIPESKTEVYSYCVRAILDDLIKAIENRDHRLRVSIEDGLSSLEIASIASASADKTRTS